MAPGQPASIKLVSHSMLFYWWPVWAFGLLFGCLSWLGGSRLAVVPEGTTLRAGAEGTGDQTFELIVPSGRAAALREAAKAPQGQAFSARVAQNNNFGILFCFILLLVVFSTSIPLRGLWSVIVLLSLLIVAGGLAMLDLWGPILAALGDLHIFISATGYLFLSGALLVLWLVTVLLFDPKRYVIFTAGQIVVHQEVGDLRQVYDTTNVRLEKLRSDLFRHVLLGFFSGDVLVQFPGAQGQQLVLPNVLFAGWKVQRVADLMKTRPIVSEALT
jgi:hypothetical protein